MNIRNARPEDMDRIVELCTLHADFEKAAYSAKGKASRLKRDIFDRNLLYCLVAVDASDHIVAYATYMTQYATWDAMHYIYMDCLFVEQGARSQGIGEKLLSHISEAGSALGCNQIQWQTPDFNTRAIKFYHRIGATNNSKERFFLSIK